MDRRAEGQTGGQTDRQTRRDRNDEAHSRFSQIPLTRQRMFSIKTKLFYVANFGQVMCVKSISHNTGYNVLVQHNTCTVNQPLSHILREGTMITNALRALCDLRGVALR
jgi:hypothetical protein